MNWKCLGANWKQVCNKYQFCLFPDPLIPIPMFNEGETESSLLEPRLLSFALSGWPGGGDVTEPSCYLGDGSGWVVGFFFFFFNGNRGTVGPVGHRLWEEYSVFFYCRAWFLYFLNLPFPGETLMISGLHLLWNRTNSSWLSFLSLCSHRPLFTSPVSCLSNRMQENHRVWCWKFQQANGTVA